MFPLNIPAFLSLVAAFAAAYGARALFLDTLSDGAFLALIAGFAIAVDLVVRAHSEDFSLFHVKHGGHVLFIPVWVLGVLWLGYTAYRLFDPQLPEQTRTVRIEDVQ